MEKDRRMGMTDHITWPTNMDSKRLSLPVQSLTIPHL